MTCIILEATPRRLPRSLTYCVPSLKAHMLHAEQLREDEFCDALRLQDLDAFELYAWQDSPWKRHCTAVASKLGILCTQVSRLLMRTKSRGSPNSFTLRTSLSRYSGNPRTPHCLQSSHTFGACAAKKKTVTTLQGFFVTPGDLKLYVESASRRKLQQTYRAVVKPLLQQRRGSSSLDLPAPGVRPRPGAEGVS